MSPRTLPDPSRPSTTPRVRVTRTAPHPVLALVFATLTALLVVFAGAGPAAAHDQLLSTDPESGATLQTAPESVELTFSGNIQDIGHEIHVTDSEGRDITQGTLGVTGKTVSQPLRDSGRGDDTYTVTWRVVSQDGHPIEGTFRYSVGAGSGAGPERSAATGGHADHEHAEAGSSAEAASPEAASSEAGSTGLPGWVLPVIGGLVVLVILLGVLFVATRPKQR